MAWIGSFTFGISDFARLLGKSPVTIRAWEHKGLIKLPREGGERKLTLIQIRELARWAHGAKRINDQRLHLIEATVTLLTQIELDNIQDD